MERFLNCPVIIVTAPAAKVVEMIEIFGDWIIFDGKRLVELPADLDPATRMRIEDHLHADDAFVDLSDLVTRRVLLDERHRVPVIIGQHPDDHKGQPAIPDDTEIITVVDFDKLKEALTGANIGFDE